MKLNDTQARILQLVANAEMRGRSQMLSLLLAEGLRFYFCDREPLSNRAEFKTDDLVSRLEDDAAAMVQAL